MKIGIDMGGTHTDGVLLKDNQVINSVKVPTDQDNLTASILKNCRRLIKDHNSENITRITLSTTLATNTIAQESHSPVGLILIPGPGLNQNLYNYEFPHQIISGYIDHRGQEVQPLNDSEITKAANNLINSGVERIGICGKFSTRNPNHELKVKSLIETNFSNLNPPVVSHKLSGELNFPRRTATTYLNLIVKPTHQKFIKAVKSGLKELNIAAPIYLLKADGGTIPLEKAESKPIITANSGPAASIMGIKAADPPEETTVGLDIGGTTTDISLFINCDPLFKPEGITIKDYKTLVRGLYTISIPCGGDSLIKVSDNKLKISPQRKGPAAAFGGNYPTVTDALTSRGKTSGNQEKAESALKPIAEKLNITVTETADRIITNFSQIIKENLTEITTRLNNQPVYTINELLTNTELRPKQLIGIGGPAKALIPRLASDLNLEYTIPDQAEVANALGAALARVTDRCSLYADTSKGYYSIPELEIQNQAPTDFDLDDARRQAVNNLKKSLAEPNEIEITSEESFNIVRNFRTAGKIIKVTAQVKPGLTNS